MCTVTNRVETFLHICSLKALSFFWSEARATEEDGYVRPKEKLELLAQKYQQETVKTHLAWTGQDQQEGLSH